MGNSATGHMGMVRETECSLNINATLENCLGSKTISLTASKGSPFSASTLNLSLYYLACCNDQNLDHSCSSYIRWSSRALNLILDKEDFSSAQKNSCCLCRIGPNQAKVIKK